MPSLVYILAVGVFLRLCRPAYALSVEAHAQHVQGDGLVKKGGGHVLKLTFFTGVRQGDQLTVRQIGAGIRFRQFVINAVSGQRGRKRPTSRPVVAPVPMA